MQTTIATRQGARFRHGVGTFGGTSSLDVSVVRDVREIEEQCLNRQTSSGRLLNALKMKGREVAWSLEELCSETSDFLPPSAATLSYFSLEIWRLSKPRRWGLGRCFVAGLCWKHAVFDKILKRDDEFQSIHIRKRRILLISELVLPTVSSMLDA